MTPETVERVLADFRTWLLDMASGGRQPPEWETTRGADGASTRGADAPRSPVDLFALIGQFTALRHEVNLQTKAARAAVEQNADVLRQLANRDRPADEPDEPPPEVDTDVLLRPAVKAVIDIADALALSHKNAEKLRENAAAILEHGGVSTPPARTGFFARLFPRPPAEPAPNPGLDLLRRLAASVADGYALSLRRVERLLPTWDVEPISCTNEPFDPELMEVVEVVGETGLPPGTVVEEVRPGYYWRGAVLRFAQVKVAR